MLDSDFESFPLQIDRAIQGLDENLEQEEPVLACIPPALIHKVDSTSEIVDQEPEEEEDEEEEKSLEIEEESENGLSTQDFSDRQEEPSTCSVLQGKASIPKTKKITQVEPKSKCKPSVIRPSILHFYFDPISKTLYKKSSSKKSSLCTRSSQKAKKKDK